MSAGVQRVEASIYASRKDDSADRSDHLVRELTIAIIEKTTRLLEPIFAVNHALAKTCQKKKKKRPVFF